MDTATKPAPIEKILVIETQASVKGIINLDEMARLVDIANSNMIIKLSNYNRSSIYIDDEELQHIDKLLDDRLINRLLSYDGCSPAMREIFPKFPATCLGHSYSKGSNILTQGGLKSP